MEIYYCLIAVLLFFVYVEVTSVGKATKNIAFILSLIAIWCVLAFRDITVGTDSLAYFQMFNLVDSTHYDSYTDINLPYEPGFYLLQVIIKKLGYEVQWLFYITAAFYCISLYCFLKHNSENKTFALFLITTLGLFQFALSGMRQTVAIGIILLAYKFVKERRLWLYIGMVILAMQFHKSSILACPIYFVAPLNLNRRNFALMMIGLVTLILTADKLLIFTAEVLEYSKYTNIEKADGGFIFFAVVLFISYFGYKMKNVIGAKDKNYSAILNINFIDLAIWGARLVSRTAERISYYFLPFTCIVLEKSLFSIKNKSLRNIYIIITIIASVYLFIKRMDNGGFEYQFFE